jgi:hypothetical protein
VRRVQLRARQVERQSSYEDRHGYDP